MRYDFNDEAFEMVKKELTDRQTDGSTDRNIAKSEMFHLNDALLWERLHLKGFGLRNSVH